ncbi:MAG: hypothetical protein ACJ8C4_21540 [Gemmataceae bacterium]
MHIRKSFQVLSLVVLVMAIGCKRQVPAWEPDPTVLSDLGPLTDFEGYQIRVPNGYSPLSPPPNLPLKMFLWVSSKRSDQTAAQLMVGIVSPPPGEANDSIEKHLDKLLDTQKKDRTDYSQTATERGTINGLAFVRAHWSGINSENQRKLHGFYYVTKEGTTFYHIRSQDVEPHHEQALKIAEATALTFKKK